MHYQFALTFRGIRGTTFGQGREYLIDIMHDVDFAPFSKNID
jgi:hypothetical protein